MQEQDNSTIKIETGYIDKLLEKKNSDWFIAEHLSNSDQLFSRKVIVSAFRLSGWETGLEAEVDPPQMCVILGKFFHLLLFFATNLISQIFQAPFSDYLFFVDYLRVQVDCIVV